MEERVDRSVIEDDTVGVVEDEGVAEGEGASTSATLH